MAIGVMKKAGIRYLISTTGTGVRDPQDQPKFIDHLIERSLILLAGEVLRDSADNVGGHPR
jgi:hypothetical protein